MNLFFSVSRPNSRHQKPISLQVIEELQAVLKAHAHEETLECVPHLLLAQKTLFSLDTPNALRKRKDSLKHDLKSPSTEKKRLALLSFSLLGEKIVEEDNGLLEALILCLTDRNATVRELARKDYLRFALLDPVPERVISAMLGVLQKNDADCFSALQVLLVLREHSKVSRYNLDQRLAQIGLINRRVRHILSLSDRKETSWATTPFFSATKPQTAGSFAMKEDFTLLSHPDLDRRRSAARRLALASQSGYRLFRQGNRFEVKSVHELVTMERKTVF